MQTVLIKRFSDFINEALGVPAGIHEVSVALYSELIQRVEKINGRADLDDIESKRFHIDGPFRIGDMTIPNVTIKFNVHIIDQVEKVQIFGAGFSGNIKRVEFKMVLDGSNRTLIDISVAAPHDSTVIDLLNELKTTRDEMISVFSHELMHKYDETKRKELPVTSQSNYSVYSRFNFLNIKPLNNLIFLMYFNHEIEKVVRPSEMASTIKLSGITQKDFYNFITNTRVYKTLKESTNLSYDKIREELKDYETEINELLEEAEIPNFSEMELDKKIEMALRLFMINLINEKGRRLTSFFDTPMSMLDMLFGGRSNMDQRFKDFIKKFMMRERRFENDPKGFYDYELKRIRYNAQKAIKKISKLYAMTPANESDTILDKDLWFDLITKPLKISKSFDDTI